MFKKRSSGKKQNIRKRDLEDENTGHSQGVSDVVLDARPTKKIAVIESSSGKSQAAVDKPSIRETFVASGTAASLVPAGMGATATAEVDTDLGQDATSILQRSVEINEELKGKADDGIYRGQAGYARYNTLRDKASGNAMSGKTRIGPVRASSNIRVTARFDYAPDICKDYQKTGFCGFGDSCIFLHDRSEYKGGWQIEKEWEEEQRKKREAEIRGEDSDPPQMEKNDDVFPSQCPICGKAFTNPVKTKCGHYFNEECAIKHFRTSPKCFVCGEPTKGIFNAATDLIAKLKERREI